LGAYKVFIESFVIETWKRASHAHHFPIHIQSKFWDNIICTLLKKIQMNMHCQFNMHIGLLIFINQNVNIIWFIKVIKVKTLIFLSVKCKLFSGLGKAWVLSLLVLISACFEFDLVIYCNFCLFWVSFINQCWFVVSCWVDYLILFLFIFGLMEFFTFLWKTCFVEKVFF
jgi:hypothetical protein